MEYLLKDIKWMPKGSKKGFYFLSGINRDVAPGHVTKLAASLDFMGNIRPIVCALISFIDGIKRLYIIDGQHLSHALLRKGWDIPYVLIEVKDKAHLIENIALLNASSKSWVLADYVKAWSSVSKDYEILNMHFNTFDFEIGVTAAVLGELPIYKQGGNLTISRRIKNGTFKVVNEKEAVKKLTYLTEALKYVPRMSRSENKYFCTEFLDFLAEEGDNYNHALMLNFLEKNKKKIVFTTQEPHLLTELLKKYYYGREN